MGKTLIDGALIVTMDPIRRVIQNGAVLIDGEIILAVGQSDQVKSDFSFTNRIDAGNKVILPGFIDTHVHLSEHICRSLIPDDAQDWMPNWLLPLYANLSGSLLLRCERPDESTTRASIRLVLPAALRPTTTWGPSPKLISRCS